jgi:prepilin-type N-terminal cleavage/methylation domain-containing protein
MRNQDPSGFTLVEMMGVVMLIGLIAAIGAVKLQRRDQENAVAGLSRELFARAMEARFLSLSSGCQAELALDPQDTNHDGQVGTVALATQPGMSPATLTFGQPSDGVAKRRDAHLNAIAPGTSLGGAQPAGPAVADALVFYPDGTVRLRSAPSVLGATLYILDTNGQHPYRVAIFGSTGFARVLSH